MSDAGRGELPGVQVGDVLHDLLKALNVIALQGDGGLVGIRLNLARIREGKEHFSLTRPSLAPVSQRYSQRKRKPSEMFLSDL